VSELLATKCQWSWFPSSIGLGHEYALRKCCRWVLLLVVTAVSSSAGPSTSSVAAEALIGPEGGELHVEKPGSPLHGFSVRVPPGALTQATTVALIHEAPKPIVIRMGEPSGVFLSLRAEGLSDFRRAVEIRCLYDAGRWQGWFPLGFAIDANNQLNVIDRISGSNESGAVVFASFVPLTFTWLFVQPVSRP
jgi:hypothetical protein